MTLARLFVFPETADWVVALEGTILGRYTSKSRAISKARLLVDRLAREAAADADILIDPGTGAPLEFASDSGARPPMRREPGRIARRHLRRLRAAVGGGA